MADGGESALAASRPFFVRLSDQAGVSFLREARARTTTAGEPPIANTDCLASCFKELQSLLHERFVVLEDAPMPGILIEDELGVRKAARQVDRVAAGHHPVVITIRH